MISGSVDNFGNLIGRIVNNKMSEMQAHELVKMLTTLREIYLRHLAECNGNEFEATRKTFIEFQNLNNGKDWIDTIAADKETVPEKGDGVPPESKPSAAEESTPAAPATPANPVPKPKGKDRRGGRNKKNSGSRTKPKGGRAKGVGNRKISNYCN